MNATSKYALSVVLALLLQGCSHYTYDGQRYGSSEEALNAQKQHISQVLAGVTKKSPYVGGKAFVYIPPRHVLRENGVKISGRAQPNETAMNYIVDSLENNFSGMAETVKKGEFFDSVVVSRNLAEIQAEKNDHVIRLETSGLGQWQWYVYRADNVSNKIPLFVEGTKTGTDRLNSFNDSLSKALVSLGSNAPQ